MNVGIVSYGAYIPQYRITVEEIAKIWGEDANEIKNQLLVESKAVPAPDEDVATMSVEAARHALNRVNINPKSIGAIYVGSESHPYAVKPTATIVASAIDAEQNLTAADLEFACKAGTAGIQICMGLVKSQMVEYGLAIGADNSQGRPRDPLEFTTGAGAAAFLIGSENVAAIIEDTFSVTTDTPDFWRREGVFFPSHGQRFTGKPAYFHHVFSASKGLMEKLGANPSDYTYAVFHQPNTKFPLNVGKMLGFSHEQLELGILCNKIGNAYSGSAMLGLVHILDHAKPGDRIFMTSYGSGAGSDAFSITVTDKIESLHSYRYNSDYYLKRVEYIDYGTYARYKGILRS